MITGSLGNYSAGGSSEAAIQFRLVPPGALRKLLSHCGIIKCRTQSTTSENAGGQQGTDLEIHNIFGPSPETNSSLTLSSYFSECPCRFHARVHSCRQPRFYDHFLQTIAKRTRVTQQYESFWRKMCRKQANLKTCAWMSGQYCKMS